MLTPLNVVTRSVTCICPFHPPYLHASDKGSWERQARKLPHLWNSHLRRHSTKTSPSQTPKHSIPNRHIHDRGTAPIASHEPPTPTPPNPPMPTGGRNTPPNPQLPRPRRHPRPPAQSPPANTTTNTNTTSVARNRQHVLRSRNAPVQRLGPVRPLPLLVVPRLPPHRARPHGLPRDARGGCRCCYRRGGGARGCGSWGGRRHRREPGVDYIRDGDGDGRGRGAGRGVFPVGEAGVSGWAGVGGEVGLLLPFSSLLWFGRGGGGWYMDMLTPTQILPRPPTLQRYARRDQVSVQGPLAARVSEAGGQSQDESQGMHPIPRPPIPPQLTPSSRASTS